MMVVSNALHMITLYVLYYLRSSSLRTINQHKPSMDKSSNNPDVALRMRKANRGSLKTEPNEAIARTTDTIAYPNISGLLRVIIMNIIRSSMWFLWLLPRGATQKQCRLLALEIPKPYLAILEHVCSAILWSLAV